MHLSGHFMSLGVLQHCHYTLLYRVVLCSMESYFVVPCNTLQYCVVQRIALQYNFRARVNLRVTETLNHSHSTAPPNSLHQQPHCRTSSHHII